MGVQLSNWEGYSLVHDGILALADIEQSGMHIDVEYCEKEQSKLNKRVGQIAKKLGRYKEIKKWKKKYGPKFKLGSDDQMADILFKVMGYTPKIFTDSGKPSVSQEALEVLNTPFIHDIVLMRRMEKASNTFLQGLLRETVDGILRPFFHLHLARTFRGSSSNVNFQNQPKRDKMMKKAIRRGFIPRRGHCLAELDYSGVEVTVSTFYHKDPTMIDDIIDPDKDMHRDMAQACYIMDDDEWTKACRQAAKNSFVFPQFYGSWYKECAVNLWFAIIKEDLRTKDGTPLRDHLKKHGIKTEKAFEKHIKGIEDYFWQEKYKVYGRWKENNWKKYLERGYIDLLTGFRCTEVMSRNDANNYATQGTAFHCLLWSLTKLHKWLRKNNMRSVIVGQIHDSIVMDIHKDEINVVLAKAKYIMEKAIAINYKWICTPLKVEMELTPVDTNWYLLNEVLPNPCKCGVGYRFMDKRKNVIRWTCPVCGKTTKDVL